jgi:type II secretory pathway component PulK
VRRTAFGAVQVMQAGQQHELVGHFCILPTAINRNTQQLNKVAALAANLLYEAALK